MVRKASAAHVDRRPGWILSRTLVWPQSGVCVKGCGHRSVLFGPELALESFCWPRETDRGSRQVGGGGHPIVPHRHSTLVNTPRHWGLCHKPALI